MKFQSSLKLRMSFIVLILCMFGVSLRLSAQDKMDAVGKQQAMDMLANVKKAIKSDYFDPDPNFGGVNLETRFKAAEEKLKTTDSLGQAFAVIAQAVVDLNDSHTMFYPPARNVITEYGWRIRMYGDRAFITAVKENSDADKKGLRIGDEVLKINGFRPARKELWKLLYYYEILSPKTTMTFEVKSSNGEVRQLQIATKVTPQKKTLDLANTFDLSNAGREADADKGATTYFKEVGNVLIWKLPTFSFDPKDVGGFVGKAKNKKALILDLRGNGGGAVRTLEEMIGYFFDHDLKIADLKGRKKLDPSQAKTKGADIFKEQLIVLIDSDSASASEMFARTIQLEKRGVVIGDLSAGAVMQSRPHSFQMGVEKAFNYGMNLSMADVIMSDGKSLEHVGVVPDELILPTGQDLAERCDPVLTRALALSGQKVESSVAGKFFPREKFVEHVSNIAFYGDIFVTGGY